MNRTSLFTIAALFLTTATAFPAATLPPNDAAWSRAVNLMPLIDPARDVIKGTWKSTGGTLISGSERYERLQIPYEPPDEYDFRIVFVRTKGNGAVAQYISRTSRAAQWVMGVDQNKIFGFQTVGGKDVVHNPLSVRSKACLQNGRISTSLLQVRRSGVKAYLDGKLISQLPTDFRDVGLPASWDMPNHSVLGLGSGESATEFQKIELLEISGKGRPMRRATVATTTPVTEQPKPKAPAKQPPKTVAKETTPAGQPKKLSALSKADPEQQKSARTFQKNQSSIRGLYVLQMPSGQHLGGADDIIATVELFKPDYETTHVFATSVASDMRISCDEAVHLVKVRYPIWKAGHQIRFSFGDKYARQSGGSAGGAFSVLLMSLLEGFTIDPHYAMTGDVTVDGKIRKVGAVAEKLRGAMLDKCKLAAIPEANKDSLNDLVILYPLSMLWNLQILSLSTLEDATAAARQDRPPNLAKALALFAQVQAHLGTNAALVSLLDPGVTQKLQEVLKLAPNHLSSEFMLRARNLQMPSALSLQSSMEEIWSAAGLMLYYLQPDMAPAAKGGQRHRIQVPREAATIALDRLKWLDTRLDPKTKNLKAAMVEFINGLEPLWQQSGFLPSTYKQLQAKRDKVWGETIKLDVDRSVLEEMMRR